MLCLAHYHWVMVYPRPSLALFHSPREAGHFEVCVLAQHPVMARICDVGAKRG